LIKYGRAIETPREEIPEESPEEKGLFDIIKFKL
jgi:hypothetical protein